MKSAISDIRQSLNIKAIATAGLTPDAIPNNTLGIIDVATNLTVAPADYAALPAQVRLINKVNGQVYVTVNDIHKNKIFNTISKAYTASQVNIWEAIIEHCTCIDNGFSMNIYIDDQELHQRDGMTWVHQDYIVDVTPEELACQDNLCLLGEDKYPTYENNIVSKALWLKAQQKNSEFYTIDIVLDIDGVTTYADAAARDAAVTTPAIGNLAILTTPGNITIYNGSAWVVVGDAEGVLTLAGMEAIISDFQTVNTDSDDTNDGPKFITRLSGKTEVTPNYKELEVNYIYPRGTRFLNPVIKLNDGNKVIAMTETQALGYEIGAGYDLRSEEFDYMSLYTKLNFYPQLTDGVASPDLVYQFDNQTNYSTVTFDYENDKVNNVGDSDKLRKSLLLASSDSDVYDDLVAIFTPA